MGVTGLWRVLEPAGRRAPLDSLRGKVLAVDISIWLHQMVKGYQDSSGGAVANAHLLGLFQRLCKLLYYGIKPVFVFDGSVPALKRNTIQNRRQRRTHMKKDADVIQQQLLNIITKHAAVNSVLGNKIPPTRKSPVKSVKSPDDDDLFKLPDLKEGALESSSSESEESESPSQRKPPSKYHNIDLHGINVHSDEFKNLPARERHDILTDLKETRKLNSWGRIHELPAQSDNFSDYQMKRLLKRRQVQVSLEEAEKEIGGHFLSINELEILLNEEGIDTKIDNIRTRQIASDENARFLLIKDVKKAMYDAVTFENLKSTPKTSTDTEIPSTSTVSNITHDELDTDIEKAIALSLECVDDKDDDVTVENDFKNPSASVANDIILVNDFEKPSTSVATNITLVNDFEKPSTSVVSDVTLEDDLNDDIQKAIALSLEPMQEENDIIIKNSDNVNWNLIKEECLSDDNDDDEPIIKSNVSKLAMARGYMMEFSGLTEYEIDQIINGESLKQKKQLSETEAFQNKNPDPIIIKDDKIPDNPEIVSLNSPSSDSDDSFEEVPEINTNSNDDMFADVFADKSKFELLDKALISTLNKKNDITNNKQIENDQVDLTINKSPEKIIEPDNDVVVSESLNSSDINVNRSPTKGIPLNSIKQLVANSEHIPKEDAPIEKTFSIEMVNAMSEDLDNQRSVLEKEKNKLDRMGRNISDEMTNDAQELLKLFGIPFIVAPTEAESQCAYLESIKLTDGTITDDSDIWLFGGKTVYRNFFNQQKQVLQFLAENIKSSFRLQREDFILLALLVGSDYTMGVSGIGPVTALEILSAFPSNKNDVAPPYTNLLNGLKKFRTWWTTKQMFTHTSLRNKLKNISLSEEFPNHKVVEAYLLPEVDKSEELFSWGKFDIAGLREFTRDKFGWTRAKTEEILNPILKRMDIKISQLSIRSFFNTEFKQDVTMEKMSKRVKKAIENMGTDKSELNEDINKGKKRVKQKSDTDLSKKPAKRKKTETSAAIEGTSSNQIENLDVPIENSTVPKIKPKTGRVGRPQKKNNDLNKTPIKRKATVDEPKPSADHELLLHFSANCTNEDSLEESPFLKHQEVIPQREVDKGIFLKNKLKAIELFRTSKKGPGFMKKRKKQIIEPKDDAELSESSSD